MTTSPIAQAQGTEPDGRAPLFAGLASYVIWGLLPLLFLWATRAGASALEIVAWRTIWALPCAALLVVAAGQTGKLRRLTLATVFVLAISAALIAINWTVFVWAVSTGRTISGSLGYYLNPLLNMAAGALLFKERISGAGRIAMALAAVGVLLQGVALGEFPWVSLVLAFSFCGYAIVRKAAPVEAQVGLLVECMILAVPAAAYALWLAHAGRGGFGTGWQVSIALTLGGPVTAVTLALFAFAARRVALTAMGFLQFVTPTLQFIVGVETGEALTPLRLLSFAFIWTGVLVFAAGLVWERRRP